MKHVQRTATMYPITDCKVTSFDDRKVRWFKVASFDDMGLVVLCHIIQPQKWVEIAVGNFKLSSIIGGVGMMQEKTTYSILTL